MRKEGECGGLEEATKKGGVGGTPAGVSLCGGSLSPAALTGLALGWSSGAEGQARGLVRTQSHCLGAIC